MHTYVARPAVPAYPTNSPVGSARRTALQAPQTQLPRQENRSILIPQQQKKGRPPQRRGRREQSENCRTSEQEVPTPRGKTTVCTPVLCNEVTRECLKTQVTAHTVRTYHASADEEDPPAEARASCRHRSGTKKPLFFLDVLGL